MSTLPKFTYHLFSRTRGRLCAGEAPHRLDLGTLLMWREAHFLLSAHGLRSETLLLYEGGTARKGSDMEGDTARKGSEMSVSPPAGRDFAGVADLREGGLGCVALQEDPAAAAAVLLALCQRELRHPELKSQHASSCKPFKLAHWCGGVPGGGTFSADSMQNNPRGSSSSEKTPATRHESAVNERARQEAGGRRQEAGNCRPTHGELRVCHRSNAAWQRTLSSPASRPGRP